MPFSHILPEAEEDGNEERALGTQGGDQERLTRDVSVDRDGSLTAESSFQEVMKEVNINNSFNRFHY